MKICDSWYWLFSADLARKMTIFLILQLYVNSFIQMLIHLPILPLRKWRFITKLTKCYRHFCVPCWSRDTWRCSQARVWVGQKTRQIYKFIVTQHISRQLANHQLHFHESHSTRVVPFGILHFNESIIPANALWCYNLWGCRRGWSMKSELGGPSRDWGHSGVRPRHEALDLNAICPKLGALLPSSWGILRH